LNSQGAISSGHPTTTQAGVTALNAGGNAVDAAISALLTACVVEPLLTGLSGAGMALVRFADRVETCDMFANMPGLGKPEHRPKMREVTLDFGPKKQVFHVGPASVGVPGVPDGIIRLHRMYGTLPFWKLAESAIYSARNGFPIVDGQPQVFRILEPIIRSTPRLWDLISIDNRLPDIGDTLTNPDLANVIEMFCQREAIFAQRSTISRQVLKTLGPQTRLSADDFDHYESASTPAVEIRYRDAKLWLPGPPSIAGALLAADLDFLSQHTTMPQPTSFEFATLILETMRRSHIHGNVDELRRVYEPQFVKGFVRRGNAGHTTHISTVDCQGNAVAVTTSLGESCGIVADGTGIILNNFLGEADVNPKEIQIQPGSRLLTMCCPIIVQRQGRIDVLGSSGSNRIRSALLHTLVGLIDYGKSMEDAVRSPRIHSQDNEISFETMGRTSRVCDEIARLGPEARRFTDWNMFFGGVNGVTVNLNGGQMSGAGDIRRACAYRATNRTD